MCGTHIIVAKGAAQESKTEDSSNHWKHEHTSDMWDTLTCPRFLCKLCPSALSIKTHNKHGSHNEGKGFREGK